jgi:5-formyltetrahydrofolate cyclo-ligase
VSQTQLEAEAKPALRDRIRAERRARSPRQRHELAAAICDVLLEQAMIRSARTVGAYASLPSEPGTGPLRSALRAGGVTVLLPIRRPDNDLDWAADSGTTQINLTGPPLPQPVSGELGVNAIGGADVVLVPALAVDTDGYRLGQGGGSYDRALHRVSASAILVALVFDEELFDAAVEPLPRESHDLRVHGVLTPSHCMLFA